MNHYVLLKIQGCSGCDGERDALGVFPTLFAAEQKVDEIEGKSVAGWYRTDRRNVWFNGDWEIYEVPCYLPTVRQAVPNAKDLAVEIRDVLMKTARRNGGAARLFE